MNRSEAERVTDWARLHYPEYRDREGTGTPALKRMERDVKIDLDLKQTSNARVRTLLRRVAFEHYGEA